jgi:PQQ-like domain
MSNSILSILCIGIFLANCSCSMLNPVDEAKPLWNIKLFSGSLALLEMKPYIWNGNTLFAGEKNGKTTLFLVENTTGQVQWEWADFFEVKDEIGSEDEQYMYQNVFCLQTTLGVYVIDLAKGKTIKRTPISQGGGNSIQGFGSTFFNSTNLSTIGKGRMENGEFMTILTIPQEMENRVILQTPVPLINNNDTLLVLSIAKIRLRDAGFFGRIALYNLSKRQFVYDSARITTNGSGAIPIVRKNRIYQSAGTFIVCNDLFTGREIWKREFGGSFLGTDFSVADEKVFAGNGDSNFYVLDAETGKELWRKTNIIATAPAPFFMNGVVYFTNGTLLAADANSGEILWQRSSPDGSGFRGRVNGADGKVYAYTRQNAYCYKAAR